METVSESVATTEGLRKGVVWPAIVLSLLVVVTFIVVGISAYGFIACGARPCGPLTCIVLPGTVFLAIVVWLSAASAVTLSGECLRCKRIPRRVSTHTTSASCVFTAAITACKAPSTWLYCTSGCCMSFKVLCVLLFLFLIFNQNGL